MGTARGGERGGLSVVGTADGPIVERLGKDAADGWMLVSYYLDKTAGTTVP